MSTTAATPYKDSRTGAFVFGLMLAVLVGLTCANALAEQAEDFGSYKVHYSAINTSQLSPEVARAFGIQRSTSRALLNLAVLRRQEGGLDQPTQASIEVQAVNIAGQRRPIELREVREQEAIYYIGTFRIANEERIRFSVTVKPEGEPGPPQEFQFQQQFFVY
jgi:hypothetical protein